MSQPDNIAEHVRRIWANAQFENGYATVPAYMLEQLAIACEVIGIEQAEYNEGW